MLPLRLGTPLGRRIGFLWRSGQLLSPVKARTSVEPEKERREERKWGEEEMEEGE